MKQLLLSTLTLILMVSLITGCSYRERRDGGMVAGGVVGGVAGNALTGGSAAGTIVGAVGGAYVGREMSR